ncbi:hypothetical protein BHE74_00050723 [Ensete ventricosum]|nr:hypothetical protein BHE74_00050723 [Ensete ventricosum]
MEEEAEEAPRRRRKQSERNKSRGVKLWLEARTERQTRGRLRAIGFLIILEVIVHCTPDDLPALGDTGERNGAPSFDPISCQPEIGREAWRLDGARRRIDGRARWGVVGGGEREGTHRHKVTGRLWLDVGASMPPSAFQLGIG